jgi:hypothetical protein
MNHTDERIKKLAAQGLSDEQIAKKIGRPGDIARVRKVTAKGCIRCCITESEPLWDSLDESLWGSLAPSEGDICDTCCNKKTKGVLPT